MKTLSEKIKYIRQCENCKQRELAAQLAISKSYLGELERGEYTNPNKQLRSEIDRMYSHWIEVKAGELTEKVMNTKLPFWDAVCCFFTRIGRKFKK